VPLITGFRTGPSEPPHARDDAREARDENK